MACVDELTTIKLILHKQVGLFQSLLVDAKKFELEDFQARNEPNNASAETSQDRVTWAVGMVKTQHDCFERLLVDLKQSMNAVSIYDFSLIIEVNSRSALPASVDRTK